MLNVNIKLDIVWNYLEATSLSPGFPLFQTDKIPWLFPDFSSIFGHFSSIFLMFCFLTENLIHFTKDAQTVHLNITKNIK